MNDFEIKDNVLVKYHRIDTTLIVPNGVEKIESCVFARCATIERITLPNGLKEIGWHTFFNCKSLKLVEIPASVEKIGEQAFGNCYSLKKVIFQGEKIDFSKDFWGLSSECITVVAPHMLLGEVPSEYKLLFVSGFINAQRSEYKYDANVVKSYHDYISRQRKRLYDTKDDELFAYILRNKFVRIDVVDELVEKFSKSNKVDRVSALLDYKEKAFTEKQKEREFDKQLGLRDLTSAELKRLWQCEKKSDGTCRLTSYRGRDVDVVVPSEIGGVQVTEIGRSGTKYRKGSIVNARSVVLPEGLKVIGNGAFYGNRFISQISIPSTVTDIGKGAFNLCASLEKVALSDNISNIGELAFANCTSLKELILPNELKKIGKYAFGYCKSLQELTLPDKLKSIGAWAFANCASLVKLTLPPKLKTIYSGTFQGCGNLSQVNFPATLTSIGRSAFAETALVNVDIPEGVKKIGTRAFVECYQLKSVILPKSLTTVGYTPFGMCVRCTLYCRCSQKNASWYNSWYNNAYLGVSRVVWDYVSKDMPG